MIDESLVAKARAAAEVIAPLAPRIEKERRLPDEAVRALVDARVFKHCVPRALGGEDAHAATTLAMIETIARADGSAGWCAMIGSTSALISRFLDETTAREVFGPADAIACGVFAPMGRATPVDDGKAYRVSGRWPFASGCEHSGWRMGGAVIGDDFTNVKSFLFRADETRIIDTWDTSGLRGTGSHDLEVTDVVVPKERVFSLVQGDTPFFGLLAAGVAAVGLGIARAAVDAFVDLAKTKRPQGSKRTLAHRETTQLDVARAEARLSAARALLFAAIEARETDLVSRAKLRLAACHAAEEAAAVTTLVYQAGGGSVIYAKHPLQRHFRDAHVVTQHVMVGSAAATMAGRILLGVETDTTLL